jgi:hypothetical protein
MEAVHQSGRRVPGVVRGPGEPVVASPVGAGAYGMIWVRPVHLARSAEWPVERPVARPEGAAAHMNGAP